MSSFAPLSDDRAHGTITLRGLLGRIGWWVVAACAIGFGLLQGRYLFLYQLRDELFYLERVPFYRAFPHNVLFMAHVAGMCAALFLGVWLLLSEYPFEPKRPKVTKLYLACVAVGGLFGIYFPFVFGPFTVSSYIIITLQVLVYLTAYQAWAHLKDRDDWDHRQWMVYNYMLVFGAFLWRVIFCTLIGSPEAFLPTGKLVPTGEIFYNAYESAWFLSLVIPLVLATVIVRNMKRKRVDDTIIG